MVKPA
jgi:hypothetical protein